MLTPQYSALTEKGEKAERRLLSLKERDFELMKYIVQPSGCGSWTCTNELRGEQIYSLLRLLLRHPTRDGSGDRIRTCVEAAYETATGATPVTPR